MAQRRKQYTREFMVRAVRLAEESPKPISEVARDLEVSYGTLYDWMKRADRASRTKRRGAGPPTAATQTPETLLAENERLRRELEETKEKLEFAKKAAAFFAQQNK